MAKGIVSSIPANKGFGFIRGDGADVFFHTSDFSGHWEDLESDYLSGQKIEVEFDVQNTPKGLRASNVRRTDWPNQAAVESEISD